MIDQERLNQAFEEGNFYALQLEVGDRCEQGCSYCYMNAIPDARNELNDETVINILNDAQRLGITAIEWLGGEPLLRPGIFRFMEYAQELGLRNNMWTGGLPLADHFTAEETGKLCRHGLIAFHLSTLDRRLYEILHPGRNAGDIDTILRGIELLLESGYPNYQILNSVTFTGLQSAEDMIRTMDYFMEKYGIQTSLNVYHTYLRPGYVKEDLLRFIPSPSSVAKVYGHYRKILKAEELPMNCVNKQYCSATLAVLHNGYVTPCATIRQEVEGRNVLRRRLGDIVDEVRHELNFSYMRDPLHLPGSCRRCKLHAVCWGCRSRAYAAGNGIYGNDPRCFRIKQKMQNEQKNIQPEDIQEEIL